MGGALTVALLLATSLLQSTDTISQQLDATDPRTVAWGAYNAAAYRRVDLIPRLQAILESPPAAASLDERAFIDAVMDSLIQLEARLPARLLVPYVNQRPIHSLLLLSKATDREGVLIELLPSQTGFQWFTAANMLVEDRSPGLVDHLVRTVTLRLTVHIVHDTSAGIGSGSGRGASIACGVGQGPAGYPPHAEYRFEADPRPGFIVLAPGPQPVYYSRLVTAGSQYPISGLGITGPTDEDRVSYLRAMAHDTGPRGFRAHTMEAIAWSTEAAVSQRVEELRAQIQGRFRSLIERACESRCVASDLPMPQIELSIVDRRQ